MKIILIIISMFGLLFTSSSVHSVEILKLRASVNDEIIVYKTSSTYSILDTSECYDVDCQSNSIVYMFARLNGSSLSFFYPGTKITGLTCEIGSYYKCEWNRSNRKSVYEKSDYNYQKEIQEGRIPRPLEMAAEILKLKLARIEELGHYNLYRAKNTLNVYPLSKGSNPIIKIKKGDTILSGKEIENGLISIYHFDSNEVNFINPSNWDNFEEIK